MHKSWGTLLFEQTNVTIADLQSLIGVSVDNNLGGQTANKLLSMLKTIPGNGCSASSNLGGGDAKLTGLNSKFVKSPTNYAN